MRRVLVSLLLIVAPVTVSMALAAPNGEPSATASGLLAVDDETTTSDVVTTTTSDVATTTTEPATTTTEPVATTTTEPATTTTATTDPSTTTEPTTTSSTTVPPTTTTTIPATAPSAPRTLTGTPGNGSATLHWVAPASNGGAALTGYVIERSINGGAWSPVPVGLVTSYYATALTNGTPVQFRLRATNAIGASPFSNVVSVIPRTVPGAPTSVAAIAVASGQIRLSWAAPTAGGSPVIDYVIERSTNGTTWTPVSDGVNTLRSYTMSDLGATTRYHFRVYAKNAAGSGPRSTTVSAIARVAPSAPRSLVLTPSSGQIRLTWLAPASNGGAAVTDYVIQRSPDGVSNWYTIPDGVSSATSYTATGLTNGRRYYFRLYATNVVGQSPASNMPSSVPRTVPSAPRLLTATPAGSGQARLAWLTPLSTGGAAVTDFIIQRSPDGVANWYTVPDGVSTATSYTATGLTDGRRYYFRVYARNAVGLSVTSRISSAVPITVPTAPTSPRAVRGSFNATVTWGAPASTGGSAVTRYVLVRATGSAGPWTPVSSSIGPTARSYTVSGLAYGQRYYFRVAAVNAAGQGLWSTVVTAVPTAPASTCHPSYPTVCIPWTGADLDCPDIPYQDFSVVTPPAPYVRDPHGFDREPDGIGCES